jgi:hypothetical protein
MSLGIQTVDAVIKPVLRELFVEMSVAGIKRKTPNKEKTQPEPCHKRGRKMFIEPIRKHVGAQNKRGSRHHCSSRFEVSLRSGERLAVTAWGNTV